MQHAVSGPIRIRWWCVQFADLPIMFERTLLCLGREINVDDSALHPKPVLTACMTRFLDERIAHSARCTRQCGKIAER